MTTIAEFMTANHKACDDEFAIAEETALAGDWDKAETAFNTFRDGMARHFGIEQDVLFPALASAGGPSGPVQVMLMEHRQINGLLEQMADAVAQKDAQEYGGLSETLLMVMQQHNHKEENILYPIMDEILSGEQEELFKRMQAV